MYACIVVIIQKMRKKATLSHFLLFLCQFSFIKHREGVFLFPREILFSPPLKENAESFGHTFKCNSVWFVVQRSKRALGHDLPSVPALYHLCIQRGAFVQIVSTCCPKALLDYGVSGLDSNPQGEIIFNHSSWMLPEFWNLVNMLAFM